MKLLAGLIFNRWVLGIIAIVAFAVIIWWGFPTIAINNMHPFESETIRWIQIAILVLAPVARIGWRFAKARSANAALIDGLVHKVLPAADARPAAVAEPDPAAGEVGQLRQRFEEAMALLRKRSASEEKSSLWTRIKSLGSRQYLYDLPWYVFIGAPGSGKTTALINSGLRFPLAARFGREAVRGVGGTRDCDWWFTDEAVFLDTAGRYTTQQSQKEVDAGAWKGFLQLLKKSRPRRPINGVLVTISMADLLEQSPAEWEAHVEAIRARVRELYDVLGGRFPIYVLVTKSDLLAGFSEFFGARGKEERAQVWGFSLPFGDRGLNAAGLSDELQRLEQRLYDRLPERLEEEREPGRRALLYGFPQQFAVLRARLVDFVENTFAPTKFEATALLRGVYFTSGTQEGNPVDRVMGALARDLGLERRLLPAQHPSGRSYFITRLLLEVVFPESGLTEVNPETERRRRLIQVAAFSSAGAVLVLATLAWWVSYRHNRDYLKEVAAQFEEVKKQVATLRSGARSDLSSLLPTLTSVRTLSETRVTPDGRVPWTWRFGLFQGSKLQAASGAAYRRMLEDTFLPSLASYLEGALRQSRGTEEGFYDTLKTYVMLYDPKHFNRDAVWHWYETRSAQLLPGAGPEAPNAVKAHFDMLYARGWVDPAVPKNDALLNSARAMFSRDSLPKQVYDRLRRDPTPDVGDFTIAEKAGPRSLLIFERRSREPLTKGIRGLYTKDGYYRYFANRVDVTTVKLAEELTWVLGTGGNVLTGAASAPALADAVKRLYLDDYRRIWREFIGDITLVSDRDLAKTIEITRTLSSPSDSPLKPLIKAIDRETSLSIPPDGDTGLAGAVAGKAQQYAAKARQALSGGTADSLVKTAVDDQFEDIHRLMGSGTGAAPIDGLTQQLSDYYQYLFAAKVALDSAQSPPPADAANKLRAEAARQPEPIRTMLQGLLEGGTKQVVEKTVEKKRQGVDADLRSQVTDFCTRAINDRYPFVRRSSMDVTTEDFARLFAPGGLMDSFFQKFLAADVDTSQKPWRYKDPTMGQSTALVEFQRAQEIRDVFFRGGGSTPSIQLDFKPIEMDTSIQQFILDVDGKIVRYAHGPPVPVRVQFPGQGGQSLVRITILPAPVTGTGGLRFDGPWALFRMFDDVKIQDTPQPDRFVATINVGGRRAVFEVLASSVRNPFRLPELSQFHCPTAQ